MGEEQLRLINDILAVTNPKCTLYFTRYDEYPWAIIHSDLDPDITVLDLGCHVKGLGLYLASLGINVVGQDSCDPDYLKFHPGHTPENFKKYYSDTGVQFIHSPMARIPFPDSYFDRIFCISLFDHVTFKEMRDGVPEITRVLKKDGLLVLTMDKHITGCKYPKFDGDVEKEKNFSTIYRNEIKKRDDMKLIFGEDVYKDIIVGEAYQKC